MKDRIIYEDFIASIHFSTEDNTFFGKIEGIDDLVTFEGDNVQSLNQAFRDAVEDYKELCKMKNLDPHKSYRGTFNVRINPELHKKAVQIALKEGMSLNQFIQKAIEDELNSVMKK
ncbi:MAG: DNA repair protein [Spirochaetes bacterium GWF1_51_8]|nr:MAG: DNA repair protein [Spirochaetes bacterium GWF1_51_8]